MHDLDERFENQDRMINYIISQFNTLETSVQKTTKRTQNN